MIKNHTKGFAILIVINLFAFLVHSFFKNDNLIDPIITVVNLPISYGVNAVLSILLCSSILLLSKIYESQIGFIFLGLSVVKMLILYLGLNPTNKLGEVSTPDAIAFFVPFGLNLIMEQIFIVKLLKINDLTKNFKKD
ncbi:hypothetical protein FHR24_000477 [Wenyingzhuangia heitensis]|uniref:Uncharacterized protein n=1 Tax=Wenyingzhuangia heitensis TaxID=1487859 RepID=A0ABX0U5A3_9FLAO|nr:DUF6168 family protein [Wenyingzhuangia heitensis]NIJ44038.1 hypothetical protein [Wenyingzhuangia heitensis]